ncbi:MAG: zinc-binding protein [Candidatus Muiribacterium halophilum]|uniref:Zinc-binding protein n=1 Tax=Muiribacterium halophilum TaxID=2053465 RepID=A0A2N5ZMC9_MUIH1|nr:MAG: zinc-binding protein [Candidatus Muirbacterium halophilum]
MVKCACGSECNVQIYSCSGAADVGQIADVATREINKKELAAMGCLAGIGGNVSGIVKSAEGADKIVVVDGCPLKCAKKNFDEKSIDVSEHFVVTEFGLKKGCSPANNENIQKIVKEIENKLK